MIYIHVPFCHRKCTYCAFYSKPVASGQWSVASYVDALLAEMELRKGEQAHPIRTVYFGGGTPSILPIDQLARIARGIHRCFNLSRLEEMTIEANPEDLSPQYLASLRRLGFNRLSIGVQSLDDNVLRLLNRRHTARQALDAINDAHAAGFDNISIDLIYGNEELRRSPRSSRSSRSSRQMKITNALTHSHINTFTHSHINTLTHCFQFITHVSAYSLTVEPGTALALQVERGRVQLPGEDEVARQYHALHEELTSAGFLQYEVSNYARPGFESKHNSRYWDRTPYLGLGPAAHSFDGTRRRWNSPMNTENGEWRTESGETLTPADAYNEMLMTALRTTRGLPVAAMPETERPKMQPYIGCGWIEVNGGNFTPTPEGLLHADGIAANLFV